MIQPVPLVVHATHEAGVKVGGIGAVLDGLLGADAYNRNVARTVLAGPLMGWDSTFMERINSQRGGVTLRYSSLHGLFAGVPEEQRAALQQIEQTFHVAILYGTRSFGRYEHEVLLVDASNPNQQELNSFKYYVWQNYGIDAARYGHADEFNLYMTIAPPLFAALKAIGADRKTDNQPLAPPEKIIIAHEWLGMPLVFAAQTTEPQGWRTVFYAHETATARWLVEEHSGHDTRFYNALYKARAWNVDLDTIWGNQDDFFKHPIIKQAVRCDNIFAVGDLVVDELRFLGGSFQHINIDLVYNGIPASTIRIQEKLESKRRLQKYCENLLGYVPDFVFTHVTRLVPSKALWRDVRVLEHLEPMLAAAGKRAVLFVLSTTIPAGRRAEWVYAWEEQYGWPIGHRSDNGDLIGAEATYFFDGVEPFNRSAQQSRIVFVNQFGWSPDRCGRLMPADMEFMDIRKGSDLEFGQSIYEPFGIAQVEPLSFGALCCVSSVCGCVGFARRAAGGLEKLPNLIVADYVGLPAGYELHSPWDALNIDWGTRDWIERAKSAEAARIIFDRLPRTNDELARLLERGQEVAQRMSWEVVVEDYLLPGLYHAQQARY